MMNEAVFSVKVGGTFVWRGGEEALAEITSDVFD